MVVIGKVCIATVERTYVPSAQFHQCSGENDDGGCSVFVFYCRLGIATREEPYYGYIICLLLEFVLLCYILVYHLAVS